MMRLKDAHVSSFVSCLCAMICFSALWIRASRIKSLVSDSCRPAAVEKLHPMARGECVRVCHLQRGCLMVPSVWE